MAWVARWWQAFLAALSWRSGGRAERWIEPENAITRAIATGRVPQLGVRSSARTTAPILDAPRFVETMPALEDEEAMEPEVSKGPPLPGEPAEEPRRRWPWHRAA